MAYHYSPKIVTDGLVFLTDPVNPQSFTSSTNVTDLISKKSGSLVNGTSFSNPFFIFDGTDDAIQFGAIDFTTGNNLTIDIWLYVGSSQVAYADIFDYDHANNGFVLQQYYPASTDNWYFAWHTGGGYDFFYLTFPLNQNFHLSITKNGSSLKAYINGLLVNTYAGNSNITGYGKTLTVGDLVASGREFNGKISSMKIYNRGLSDSEVYRNFESIKKRFGL